MPRFEPFAGVRYADDVVDLADVIAPPYDVIDAEQEARLVERSEHNAVRVELPRGDDPYAACGARFDQWLDRGVLRRDEEPAFYVYRMGYHDEGGRARQTSGVIGAMALEGDILPHERTLPKPKGDRLEVLRACRANLSPVWGLSLATGLSGLCELPGPPDARATDEDGVHHRLWRITQPGVVEAIATAVASEAVVIADGHHRYETALAYREEHGGVAGDHDLLMTYVVELAEEQLTVRPIHRLVTGVDGEALLAALTAAGFEAFDTAPAVETLPRRMVDAGALALVLPGGTWLLRPTAADPGATDSELLDGVLPPGAELSYDHDAARVASLVSKGDATAGLLLRAPTVTQIATAAHARRRMPEKTTYFHPKPRTGMVFRPLD